MDLKLSLNWNLQALFSWALMQNFQVSLARIDSLIDSAKNMKNVTRISVKYERPHLQFIKAKKAFFYHLNVVHWSVKLKYERPQL